MMLPTLLPLLVKSTFYNMLLESSASENAARMMAMEAATKNAGDVIAGLSLKANKVRQEKITQELAELSAGANF